MIGWIGLGNTTEARAELSQVSPARQNHPDVLEAHWLLSAKEEQWEEGLKVAELLLQIAPDRASGWLHQSYALRRVPHGGVKNAWDALLPAFERFPTEEIISYNLACYACQLKQLDAAKDWLQRAMLIGEKEHIKRMALADSDLEALWDVIGKL